jgi:hypothetical protein
MLWTWSGGLVLDRIALTATVMMMAGCRPTSPEASEQLARAFRARMWDVPVQDAWSPFSEDRAESWDYWADTALSQSRFAGVSEGVPLDREHARLVELWWGGNTEFEPIPDAPYPEQREPLARYMEEQAERYRDYAPALKRRIQRDPHDTASLGLLATSVLLHCISSDHAWFGYGRTELLAETIEEVPPPPPPACALHSAEHESTGLTDCMVDYQERVRIRPPAVERALTWFDRIAPEDPDSTWLEVGKLILWSDRGGPPYLEYARSTARTVPTAQLWLALDAQAAWLNSDQVMTVEEFRLIEPGSPSRLLLELSMRRSELAYEAWKAGETYVPRVAITMDRKLLVDDLMTLLSIAGQAGFGEIEFIAEGNPSGHVIAMPAPVGLPLALRREGERGTLTLPSTGTIEDVVAAIDADRAHCAEDPSCEEEAHRPTLDIEVFVVPREVMDEELFQRLAGHEERLEQLFGRLEPKGPASEGLTP